VIEDDNGNIVLIKRRYPPYQNYYALPGGTVEKGEKTRIALLREILEETNLKVKIENKIGIYKEEGRDPRGNIHSTAYKCKIIGDIGSLKSGDDAKEVELIHKSKLKELKLAFDHKQIIKDANLID
ncbi:MAG: NUDIX domain-containing protein, partial [Candidatus Thorarchaeota archaeon]